MTTKAQQRRMKEYKHGYYIRHKAKILEQMKAYYDLNKDWIRVQQRKYYIKNRKKILAGVKAYTLAHLDAIKERKRRKYHKNKKLKETQAHVHKIL